jgi:hypothetical protein
MFSEEEPLEGRRVSHNSQGVNTEVGISFK